ncbi:MAG: hypothetical protein LAN37_16645 [Acidobacteriia bacterium]|nr:hypothetical protein [Terriglobia bacterium]
MNGGKRDLMVALSVANLSLLEVWRNIVFATPYLLPLWTWRDLVAALFNLAWLTVLCWVALRSRNSPRWSRLHLDRLIFVLPAVVFANFIQHQFPLQVSVVWEDRTQTLLACAGFLLIAFAIARWTRRAFALFEFAAICLLAFLPLAFVQAAWVVAREQAQPRLAGRLASPAPAHRVVWVILDEMDWRYTFPLRPAWLHLPEVDRLRSESFNSDVALESGLQTGLAMPSLILGKTVYSANPQGTSELLLGLNPDPGAGLNWPKEPNLFDQARRLGYNVGVVGWFLPYCRMFAESLASCYWEAIDSRVRDTRPSLWFSIRSQIRTLSPVADRMRHVTRYRNMMTRAKAAACDPSLQLVLLHLPVPHPPGIYDRETGTLTAFDFRDSWYFDNLALADRTVGELRHSMEEAGVWDSTTVLVSTDHALRWITGFNENTDPRVPFLLKLAGQHQGFSYSRPFTTLLTHDLILDVLQGRLSQPEDVARWIDRRPPARIPRTLLSAQVPGSAAHN